jgi:hypothetical protein
MKKGKEPLRTFGDLMQLTEYQKHKDDPAKPDAPPAAEAPAAEKPAGAPPQAAQPPEEPKPAAQPVETEAAGEDSTEDTLEPVEQGPAAQG